MSDHWHDRRNDERREERRDRRRERRSTAARLLASVVVLGGGYAGLCLWSSQHVPATASVGGIQIGGMTPEAARTSIARGAHSLLQSPIALSVPGRPEPVQVVPQEAGLSVDTERSLEGLTGLVLDPRVVWDKLTGAVREPLLTTTDDAALTTYLARLAPSLAVAPVEGRVTFPGGLVSVDLPDPGRALDVAATKLALRRAFPDYSSAAAVFREIPPQVSAERLQQVASQFGSTAMSGSLTVVAGSTQVLVPPAAYAPMVSVVPDGAGGLAPHFDMPALARLVLGKVKVTTRA